MYDEFIDTNFKSSPESASTDWIRQKVEREGTQARNIIRYNLPFNHEVDFRRSAPKVTSRRYQAPSPASTTEKPDNSSISSSGTASTTRRHRKQRRRDDYRARYWGQMLDTLKRTIDEIYAACELDESEVECKEVIMILSHSRQDFYGLIDKLSLLQRVSEASFENRPSCLAWDERKISPGKPIKERVLADLDIDLSPSASPPTPKPEEWDQPASGYRPTSALAWGSDEEDLLNGNEDETHFDEVIKSVACTERLLRTELGRAQSEEEATLRQLEWGSDKDVDDEEEEEEEDVVVIQKSSCRVCYACGDATNVKAGSRFTKSSETTSTDSRHRHAGQQKKTKSVAVETDSADGFDGATGTRPRIPGRSVKMHEKLSSQRKPCESSIQEIEAKQARARSLRQHHLLERSNRVRELSKKVEEVREQKLRLIHQRRNFLEQRLHTAEAKRLAELQRRILKAHDEEIKGREIAFIQTLEAEQKQHTIFAKHEISKARLEERNEIRRRRLEEKAEREEAAKLRRFELETMRLARLDELQARWSSRAHVIEQRAEQTELVRRAAARTKEHNREVKLATLDHQQRMHLEELRSKMLIKQRACERRHQETLSGIRRKALEMSAHPDGDVSSLMEADDYGLSSALLHGHKNQPRWCRVCRVEVAGGDGGDDSGRVEAIEYHFATRGHRRALLNSLPASQRLNLNTANLNAACLGDLPATPSHHHGGMVALHGRRDNAIDRQYLLGRRQTVIRQRLTSRCHVYRKSSLVHPRSAPNCSTRQQLQKLIKEAWRFYSLPESGPWVATRVAAMEKTLNAINRLLCAPSSTSLQHTDKASLECCFHLDLLPVLIGLVDLIRSQRYFNFPIVPTRLVSLACCLLLLICENLPVANWHLLFNGDLALLVDCLAVKVMRLETLELHQSLEASTLSHVIIEEFHCIQSLFSCLLVCCRVMLTSQADVTKFITKSLAPNVCISDFIAYLVNSGLLDLLTARLSSPALIVELLDTSATRAMPQSTGDGAATPTPPPPPPMFGGSMALLSIDLLTSLVKLIGLSVPPLAQDHKRRNTKNKASLAHAPAKSLAPPSDQTEVPPDDPTFFFDSVASTEAFGLISLLYGTLLISNSAPNTAPSTPRHRRDDGLETTSISHVQNLFESCPLVMEITLSSLRFINHCAVTNNNRMQTITSSDATCVQLRQIFSSLLNACTPTDDEAEKNAEDQQPPLLPPTSSPPSSPAHSSTSLRGCLAGKRRQQHSGGGLIPSGAREVAATCSKRLKPAAALSSTKKKAPTESGTSGLNIITTTNSSNPTTSHRILHEAIICLGYLSRLHEGNQQNLCRCPPVLLMRLCRLPVAYFSEAALADILYPTLISCCFLNTDNASLLVSELNPGLVANYIEARFLEKKLAKPSGENSAASSAFSFSQQQKKLTGDSPWATSENHSTDVDDYHRFDRRFPMGRWQEALNYFSRLAATNPTGGTTTTSATSM